MENRELVRLLNQTQIVTSDQKRGFVGDFGRCRTIAKGCQVAHCDCCHRSVVIYNPCNRRGCPVCGQKNQLAWLEAARERLLPTGHLHLVFSFPEEFTDRWRREPRKTVGLLMGSVNRVMTLHERQSGMRVGRMQVFQSHAKGLSYKAHVHCLVTDGGLVEDKEWVRLPTLPLTEMTRWLAESLKLKTTEGLSIHLTRHERNGQAVVGYLGHRQFGQIVKANQIDLEPESAVINDRGRSTRIPLGTFAQRYVDHIPEKGTVMVRHYGLYSNRNKHLHAVARAVLTSEQAEEAAKWVPECPTCKKELRIVTLLRPYYPKTFEPWGFGEGPPEHWQFGKAIA